MKLLPLLLLRPLLRPLLHIGSIPEHLENFVQESLDVVFQNESIQDQLQDPTAEEEDGSNPEGSVRSKYNSNQMKFNRISSVETLTSEKLPKRFP